jgi:hypothetical protein
LFLSPHAKPGRRRCGAALVIALSVLAILTILVTALAASLQVAANRGASAQTRQKARQLIRLGLESARTQIAKGAPGTLPSTFATPQGACELAVRAAAPGDATYESPLLAHRPGDYEVTVAATVRHATRNLRIEHVYLVNTSPNAARQVRLAANVTQPDPAIPKAKARGDKAL